MREIWIVALLLSGSFLLAQNSYPANSDSQATERFQRASNRTGMREPIQWRLHADQAESRDDL